MARRRRKIARRKASSRRVARRTSRSKNSSSNASMKKLVFGAMLYGAARDMISDRLSYITAKIPFGEFSDEAVMLGISYIAAKGKIPVIGNNPIVKNMGMAGVTIESALLGKALSDVVQGSMGSKTSGSSTTITLSPTIG